MILSRFALIIFMVFLFSCINKEIETLTSTHDLKFQNLATSWDEAIPLGNGMLGALVWQKEGKLRFSLDRADLWDLRPMENLDKPEWKFNWVYEQWKSNNYETVQNYFDAPYDRNPAPSKIPAGALEFDVSNLGEIESVQLYVESALCEIKWKSGVNLQVFIHATDPLGWYRFTGLKNEVTPGLIPPAYHLEASSGAGNPVTGKDLRRLDYPKGIVITNKNESKYKQIGWGGFQFEIDVKWEEKENSMEGCWSISSSYPAWEHQPSSAEVVKAHFNNGFVPEFDSHQQWWKSYWAKSSIRIPDTILEKQYYLEMYKFGAAARDGAPPISLQAVWTADNGKLPPWKGDFHHDLNTQLSYWPAYIGNHLEEEMGFLNWLWKNKPVFEKYTKDYYGSSGLNVPGVTTLTGDPMGGWIQYSFGPTVSAWLGFHFYQHWIYSRDSDFLKEKAYPWISDVAIFLEELSVRDENGFRKLPISSSPEINDNSKEAWFEQTTNFDLSLIKWAFSKASELAYELELKEEAEKWAGIYNEWPELAIDPDEGLLFAPDYPYHASHRHFSHLMAYHPLGLLDYSNGVEEKHIVDNTIQNLEKYGSDWWVGYSFSWFGNIKARAFDGEGAVNALRTFATAFCLSNSFHVNGDQSGNGYSKFTYRPFTLEGNFAFASGVQEMLLQSHTGVITIFPAIPDNWETVSFTDLRANGAFLISASKENGKVMKIIVKSEKGGRMKMVNPFDREFQIEGAKFLLKNNIIEIDFVDGQNVNMQVTL
jgi:alpha-L-fucosidase 2